MSAAQSRSVQTAQCQNPALTHSRGPRVLIHRTPSAPPTASGHKHDQLPRAAHRPSSYDPLILVEQLKPRMRVVEVALPHENDHAILRNVLQDPAHRVNKTCCRSGRVTKPTADVIPAPAAKQAATRAASTIFSTPPVSGPQP